MIPTAVTSPRENRGNKMKVYKEWLTDENNNIAYKTLADWAVYFGLKKVENTNWCWRTRDGKFIDIEIEGGYGLLHKDFDKYANKMFFVGNADLDRMKIRIK